MSEIFKAFRDRLPNQQNDSDETSKKVSQFSDSITVSYNLDEDSAVYHLLFDTYMLQIELLRWGIIVRGAIATGKLYHDDKLVFGPALIKAVELEKDAKYPRVILDKKIIDIGKENHAKWHSSEYEEKAIRSLIEQDFDGEFYIDYFGVSPYNFDDGWEDISIYLCTLKKFIENSIQGGLHADVICKFMWMKDKFNDIIYDLERSNYKGLCGWGIPDDVEIDFTPLKPIKLRF
ncbi:hypothetical protein LFE_0615 [Leptospirillum ferrooxidans C2-3]|uniref:Uncharacterized protein n=1 Tax=Leptospirillum ferrooxidans (strain C2-3) TaxID=1162668 RepID=I0IM32_LEPFC|nr:hypothetical protein LFE_0615 [Leptospirillum ferrooxidans C2-3]